MLLSVGTEFISYTSLSAVCIVTPVIEELLAPKSIIVDDSMVEEMFSSNTKVPKSGLA